jgi:hypothetical protein
MKADNPLRGYLGSQRIRWDAEIDRLLGESRWAPDEEPIGFCQMVGGWTDFTTAVKKRSVELHPGFYGLHYVGWGLTGLYVVFGTRETVLGKLTAIVKEEAEELARLKATWKDPTRLTMPVAFKIGPYELGAFDPNLGIEMGHITYYIDGIGGRGFPGHIQIGREGGKATGQWVAIHVKVNQEHEIYEEVELDKDIDVCALTARLAANWTE